MKKICFQDFWPGFQPNHNFLFYLFKDVFGDVQTVSDPSQSDFQIFSCFGNQNKIKKGPCRIFYTGENIRPDFSQCDYSLTFDFEDYGGKNIRLPLWLWQIDWWDHKDYENPKFVLPYDEIEDNRFIQTPKTKEVVAVFNNPEKHRVKMVEELRNLGVTVDCYGKPFNNWFYGEEAKYETISQYKFSICFENTLYPGYYTEKLFHAKTAGTVPLYYADDSCHEDFDFEGFLNLHDFEDEKSMAKYVKELLDDPQQHQIQCLNQTPLFNKNCGQDPVEKLEDIKWQLEKALS